MSEDEVVEYLVLNAGLGMSPGKAAAQAAHAAVRMAHGPAARTEAYRRWIEGEEKKIALAADEATLRRLAETVTGAVAVRDAGYTEVEAGSLTVVALPPMPRSKARRWVGGLGLYRG